MKNLKEIISIAAIAAMPFIPVNANAEGLKLFKEFDVGLRYEQPLVSEVRNIPLSVRNVPNHKDDYQGSNQGPIEKDSLNPSSRLSFGSVQGGLEADIMPDKLSVKVGAGLDFSVNSQILSAPNNRDDVAERNYQGNVGTDNRSTGAALTYIHAGTSYFAKWNTFMKPYAFGEVDFNLSKSVELNLGARVSNQDLFLENGWDRYGSYEVNEKFGVANYTVLSPYVSIKKRIDDPDTKKEVFLGIQAGFSTILTESEKDMGRIVEIEKQKAPWFIGLRAEINF